MEISNNENKILFLISYPTNKIYVHKPLQTIILQAMACMIHVLSRLLWELSWVCQGCLHWTLLISSPTMWVLHSTCRVPCHLVVTLYRFWPLTLWTCALNPPQTDRLWFAVFRTLLPSHRNAGNSCILLKHGANAALHPGVIDSTSSDRPEVIKTFDSYASLQSCTTFANKILAAVY